jgi:hypothetical protein
VFVLPKGRLTCETTNVFFAASMANAMAYLRIAGSAWHALAAAGPADGRAEGDGLGRCRGVSHRCLCQQAGHLPKYHPHRLYPRDTHTGPVSGGDCCSVASLVGNAFSEGAAAKHYPGSPPSIETGGRMERSRRRTRPSGAWFSSWSLRSPLSAPAAAGDCFGATC